MRDLDRTRRLVALRRRLEDQRRGALLRAEAEVRAADAGLREAVLAREAFARSLTRVGAEAAGALSRTSSDADAAQEEVRRRSQDVEGRRGEADVARAALADASRSTKALERAFGRLARERRAALARREQQLLDELAARAV
ncbi:MAG: flagellar FliJ family protein, partial [Myxococcota bacterium]